MGRGEHLPGASASAEAVLFPGAHGGGEGRGREIGPGLCYARLSMRAASPKAAVERRLRRGVGAFVLASALASALALSLLAPAEAWAESRVHVVHRGHTLTAIAGRYGVTVEDICAANGISPKVMLKPGQKLIIPSKTAPKAPAAKSKPEKPGKTAEAPPQKPGASPEPGARPLTAKDRAAVRWHRVAKGQHLGSIARRYGVSVEAVCHANGIKKSDPLKIGLELAIPAASDAEGLIAKAVRDEKASAPEASSPTRAKSEDTASWKKYQKKPKTPGEVVLVKSDGTSWRGRVRGKNGGVVSGAKKAFRQMLATRAGAELDIDPRLIALVAQVSDTFGGRTIRIVSGYRNQRTRPGSRHRHGRALDFTVDGVPVEALRDYCKTLDKVGIGYYPNSRFIHLDVRDRWTYWIDYSGPGQPARYGGFWTKSGRVH